MQTLSIEATRDATVEEKVAALRDQILHFRKQVARDRTFRLWRNTSSVVGILAFVLIAWASGTAAAEQWLGAWAFPGYLVLILLVAVTVIRVRNAQYYRAIARLPNNPHKTPRHVALEGDALVCQGPGICSRIAISAIADIVDGKGHLMIYLSPGEGIILAKGAFDSRVFESFRAELTALWQTGRPGVAV